MRVVHIAKGEPFDIRIDRSTKWGCPYIIGRDGNRAEVIRKYEKYLKGKPALMAALPELAGKTLACWCSPQPCHGDILLRLANKES